MNECKLYRVNGSIVNKERFTEIIKNNLDSYRFASIEQLSIILRANKHDVAEVLFDYIIKYTKNHDLISVKDICTRMSVKSKYVLYLVNQERLTISDIDTDSLADMESATEEYINEVVENIKKNDLIQSLNDSITPVVEHDDKVRTRSGFHSNLFYNRNN